MHSSPVWKLNQNTNTIGWTVCNGKSLVTDAFRLLGTSPPEKPEQLVHPIKCSWSFYTLVAVEPFSRTGLCILNVRKRALSLCTQGAPSDIICWVFMTKINSFDICGSITSGYSYKFTLIRHREQRFSLQRVFSQILSIEAAS